ncbi:MAG: polysaccharide biosynthesis C-terminal domain-containing protein [Defluviitaleaceae bacterium]|nr:polysaccharide biosynthesis C-terminal domain-containing protein [Defluviitaleaceae bacterium]
MPDKNSNPTKNPDALNSVAHTGDNRHASHAAAISLVGRFLTFVGRTMYMAMFGTANALLNAFAFAIQVPNVIFTVVNSALTAVFIPVYNSLLAEEKPAEAKKFIDNAISISVVVLGFFVVAGVVGAPIISRLLSGGEFYDPEYVAFLTFSLRVLMPVMIFFGFNAIFQGLLQSHGSFRLPAFVSAPGGIILIVYIVFFGERFGVTGLVFATALGIFMQPVILLPSVWRLGYRYKFSLDLKDKNVRAAGKLCIPVVVSAASYQMHFLFGGMIALRLNTTAVLDYSQQVVQVLILTMVYAIAAVYFPKLSLLWAKARARQTRNENRGARQARNENRGQAEAAEHSLEAGSANEVGVDTESDFDAAFEYNYSEYNETLRNAMLYTFFLVLPAATGVFLLRTEIMDFLLNRRGGSDVSESIIFAGNLMGAYSIGVIAIAFKEVADRAFYSEKDSVTPAIFGVLIMVLNIGAVLLLIRPLGAFAMPAAYGIAALIGGGGLLFVLQRRIKFINLKFLGELLKNIAATGIMLIAAFFVRNAAIFENRILNLILPAAAGAVVYFVAAVVLRISVVRGKFKSSCR